MKQTILMIEDNPNILRLNRSILTARGYRVLEAATLEKGRDILERENPGLIILDIMLPDGNGLDFCEELRQKSNIPILLLTALKENVDEVNGLTRGGDDYMTKPYNMDVFLARVATLLRRAEHGAGVAITRGELSLDTGSQTLKVKGKDTALTQREFTVLQYLLRNDNREVGAEELYEAAWGQPMANNDKAVKNLVSRLRKKIHPAGYDIADGRGKLGYHLTEFNTTILI